MNDLTFSAGAIGANVRHRIKQLIWRITQSVPHFATWADRYGVNRLSPHSWR